MPDSVTLVAPGQAAVFAPLQGGDGVIIDTNTTFYYGLNRTAAYLWQALQDGERLTRDQLVDSLCGHFEVGIEAARVDVDRFLGQLERYGLVERSAG